MALSGRARMVETITQADPAVAKEILDAIDAAAVLAGNNTFTGNNTFNGTDTNALGASTPAAGTTTADAGVLPAATASVYPTTAADGTKGVRINAADQVTGRTFFILNGAAAVLKVYAPSGGTINNAAADAAFSTASGKGCTIICLSGAGNTWNAI